MKSIKEFLINESQITKEKKEEVIKFVKDYFDKFDKDPKNFLKHKFEKKSNYEFHGWSIESLLNCNDIPQTKECRNLLYLLSEMEINGKIMPDYYDGNITYLSHMSLKSKRNSLIKKYLGAYKAIINKREKNPSLLFQLALRDYDYITNFEKYNNGKILKDQGFLELYHFTSTKNYEFTKSDKDVTMKLFLWNDYWPIIRFDFGDINEESNQKNDSYDINFDKFIICMPGKFIDLNLE